MRKLRNWGSTVASALLLLTLQSVARADELAYMATGTGQFGTIDLTTGVFSLLGSTGQTLAGPAVVGATLYGTSYHTAPGTLYQVNTANGSLTSVGTSSIDYDCFGSTLNGLYALDTSANLYSINPSTGATTLIGPTGFSLGFGSWRSLSTNASLLYFANAAHLYTLNTTTGAPTLVGNMGGPQMGGMVMEGGVLYGGVDSLSPQVGASVDTINTSTGAATTGPSLTGTTGTFYALAPTIAPSSGQTYVIAHFPFGGGWSSRLMIGAAAAGATVDVSFFSQSGATATVPLQGQGNQSAQQFQLAPNAVAVTAADPTQRNAGPLEVTWALATSTAPVNVFTLFDYAPSKVPTTTPATQIQGSVGAQSVATSKSFHFPVSVYGPLNFNAGLAIANPNRSSTTYTVTLFNPDGSQNTSVQSPALPPNGQAIFVITDLFGPSVIPQDSANPFNGSVVVCTSQPVGLVAIGVEGNAFFTISATNDYACP